MLTLASTPAPMPMPEWMADIPPAAWLAGGILLWILFAWMVGRQAKAKGHSFWKFFLGSFLVSPFALSFALHLMRPAREQQR